MSTFDVFGSTAALLVAIIALIAGTRLLRWLIDVLPLGHGRRAAARRWLPAVQLVFGVAVIVLVAVFLLGRTPALVVGAAAALLVTGAAWFAIRDLIAGVVLRAEYGFEPGHIVYADDATGRVHRVGVRSVEIERTDGRRVRVPYSRLRALPISVTRPSESGGALRFTVTLPRHTGGRDDTARIRAAALHAFFASPHREPHIQLVAEDAHALSYDVTVYAADPSFVGFIEQEVGDVCS
ncbi:MAG TPA: mechanosensitive ion channel domain-containing protein [Longimicrobiales bacterium]|nr:mechanosensitive ion channel domain-containing protein [Longimicrobiales bacterium]